MLPHSLLPFPPFLQLMDVNGDGVISWDEFYSYMSREFNAGKSLMSGE